MKKGFLPLCLLAAISGKAQAIDMQECSKLATLYKENRFSMSVGQLDALRLCVVDQMRLMMEEKQNEKEARAISRNFGKGGDDE